LKFREPGNSYSSKESSMFINEFTGALGFQFSAHINLRFGAGTVAALPAEVVALGARKVMVVTDPGVHQAGLTKGLLDGLKEKGVAFEVFAEVESNPRDTTIHAGAARAAAFGPDLFIGFGGGSAMDAAKGIALLVTNGGSIGDYDGTDKVKKDLPYLIAVPTTAGTGSEVTANAALTNSATHSKMSVRSPRLMPKMAVVDPLLLASLPKMMAATAGLDALSHAIEGFLSVRASLLSDVFALESIRLIGRNLRPFVANPANVEAASGMALGSTLAGFVISNTGTGNDHAIARALGGLFDTPHGLATGVLLAHVMRFNAPARPERFMRIAQALSLSTEGSDVTVAECVCEAVERLVQDVGVPTHLASINVDRARIPDLVAIALRNVGPNPRRTSADEMKALIETAFGKADNSTT
jgi:alcohol dehydrogenase class IV